MPFSISLNGSLSAEVAPAFVIKIVRHEEKFDELGVGLQSGSLGNCHSGIPYNFPDAVSPIGHYQGCHSSLLINAGCGTLVVATSGPMSACFACGLAAADPINAISLQSGNLGVAARTRHAGAEPTDREE
jgi:hypothetical protein